jgi:hypothetical protein
MAGLVPAIHVFDLLSCRKDVDARDKRGHDDIGSARRDAGRHPITLSDRA